MGYGPWGHKESDMTEQLTLSLYIYRVKKIYFSVYIYIYLIASELSKMNDLILRRENLGK